MLSDITSQRRSEAELERYAQVAAHDLREPLMAIGLFVEQIASGLDNGRGERNEHLVGLLRRTVARGSCSSTASWSTRAAAQRLKSTTLTWRSSSPTC